MQVFDTQHQSMMPKQMPSHLRDVAAGLHCAMLLQRLWGPGMAKSKAARSRQPTMAALNPHLQQDLLREAGLQVTRTPDKLATLWAGACVHGMLRGLMPVPHKRPDMQSPLYTSGYGNVLEAVAVDDSGKQHSLIIKEVAPPAGESGVSHERKLHSYQVQRLATAAAPEAALVAVAVPPPVPLPLPSLGSHCLAAPFP